MINLIGTYECKADVKGRLMISSALKKQLMPVLQDSFVLKRAVFQPCLELYPMAEWNAMMQKISKLNRFVKKNNDFIRLFTAGLKMVELDVSGRLLIPADLQKVFDANHNAFENYKTLQLLIEKAICIGYTMQKEKLLVKNGLLKLYNYVLLIKNRKMGVGEL